MGRAVKGWTGHDEAGTRPNSICQGSGGDCERRGGSRHLSGACPCRDGQSLDRRAHLFTSPRLRGEGFAAEAAKRARRARVRGCRRSSPNVDIPSPARASPAQVASPRMPRPRAGRALLLPLGEAEWRKAERGGPGMEQAERGRESSRRRLGLTLPSACPAADPRRAASPGALARRSPPARALRRVGPPRHKGGGELRARLCGSPIAPQAGRGGHAKRPCTNQRGSCVSR